MAFVITELSAGTIDGVGAFDKMMAAVKLHVLAEFNAGRIKGNEYATVYLGAMSAVLDRSLDFLVKQQSIALEVELLQAQIDKVAADQALVEQQTANAVIQGTVLVAEECLLRAQFDLAVENKLKAVAETALLNQKKVTEQAQTSGTGIDAGSVIGKQIALYTAQTDGFARDAEQKAAQILAQTWSVRRTTDEGTQADATNKLNDATIGSTITKMLTGIGV